MEGQDAVDLLEDFRSFLADNWTFTDRDLRAEIRAFDDAGIEQGIDTRFTLEEFDRGRTWLSRARTFKLLVYLPVALVLVFIGLLGGRTWRGGVGWAAGYLAVSAAIIFSISGPVFGALTDERIDDLRIDALGEVRQTDDFQLTQRLAIDKGFELLEAITDTFASGVANKSGLILVLSLVALGIAIFWPSLRGLARRGGEPATESGMPPSDTGEEPTSDVVQPTSDVVEPFFRDVEEPPSDFDEGSPSNDEGGDSREPRNDREEPPSDSEEPPSDDEDTRNNTARPGGRRAPGAFRCDRGEPRACQGTILGAIEQPGDSGSRCPPRQLHQVRVYPVAAAA